MAKNILNMKTAILTALVFAVVVVAAQLGGVLSLLSPPMQTELKDGTVWWHALVNVDDIGEGLYFYVDSGYIDEATLDDGTKVTPKTSFGIDFSPKESSCSYTLTKDSQFSFFGYTFGEYYKLSNPTRKVSINVLDMKNNVLKELDATQSGTVSFKDLYDGEGIVEIRPQGILSGSKDCPESSNVVVIFKNEEPIYYDRIDFNQKREDFSITTITSLAKMKEFLFNFLLDVDTADSFTDEFKSYTLTANEYTKSVSGGIDKLGTGVIAVAVSEEFVDAMRYSPAEHSEPRITAINTADEIKTGNKGILRVMIENRNDNTGLVEVEPIATNLAFTPRMREVTLDGAGSVGADFTFQAGKIFEDTPTEICVDVTSLGSQFGGSNTDRYCKTITITKEQSEDEPYCGDGTCQPDLGETYSSCPADCTGLNLCVDIDNSEPNWLGKCVCIEGYNPIIEGGQLSCKADKDYTPYFILGGLAFAGFLFMLLVIVIAIQFKKK